MHFYNCGNLRATVPGLILSLVICIELVHGGLDIILVVDDQKAILELHSEGQFLFDVSLAWCLSDSSTA